MEAVSVRSYTLKVCEYRGSKFLSTSKEHSNFEEMADIGKVEEDKKQETSTNVWMPSKWMKDAQWSA